MKIGATSIFSHKKGMTILDSKNYNDAVARLIKAYRILTSVENTQLLLDTVKMFDGKCFNKRFMSAVNDLSTPTGYNILIRYTGHILEIGYYRDGDYSKAVYIPLYIQCDKAFADGAKKRINGKAISDNIMKNASIYVQKVNEIENANSAIAEKIEKHNNLLHEAEDILDKIPYELKDIYCNEFYRPFKIMQ